MKKEIKDQNYCCTVVKIKSLRSLANLDNLMAVDMYGFTGLVTKDYEVGQLCLMFTAESQLSEDFCFNNNLFRHKELNKDKKKSSYLEDSKRIRCIKIRGNVSSALFMPISSLSYLVDVNLLKEGDCFNSIEGIEVCRKYVIRQQVSTGPKTAKNRELRKSRIDSRLMPEHVSTSHWLKCEESIDDDTYLIKTVKLHGCVHHSTIIDTEVGPKTIKEIVDNRLDLKIKAFDTTKKRNVFTKIHEYYFKKDTTDWYEIETEDGRFLKITGNNPVWLPDLNCYRNTEDLVVGDVLLVD